MRPRGDFGNHTAETGVQVGLGGDNTGENLWLFGEDRGGGFVAGGFYGEEIHETRDQYRGPAGSKHAKPACSKCLSFVKASRIFSFSIRTKLQQSTRPHDLSGRVA